MNKQPLIVIVLSAIVVVGVALVVSPRHAPFVPAAELSVNTSANTSTEPEMRTVELFYYSPADDMDADGNIQCSTDGLVAVERDIPFSPTLLTDTINTLLRGNLTQTERQAGITTEFPLDGLKLVGINVSDGEAVIALDDPQHRTSGGSCRARVLRAQITETALQFETVDIVRFIPETLFQP